MISYPFGLSRLFLTSFRSSFSLIRFWKWSYENWRQFSTIWTSRTDGVKHKVSYFYDPEVGNYYYGQGHPMNPIRIRMTHALLARYGLVLHMYVLKPYPSREKDLCRFHADDYVSFLNLEEHHPRNTSGSAEPAEEIKCWGRLPCV